MEFQEYTGWKQPKTNRAAKVAAFICFATVVALSAAATFGLLWLGCALDCILGG